MATPFNETPIVKPIPRSNYPNTGGRPVPRDPVGAILHHIVGSLPGCTAHFQNPNTGYATNFGIGSRDGRGGGEWQIHEYVPADAVAWGNGNTHLNEAGVSIEHENNLAIAINGKPRDEVHELSARFLASLARRFDWRIGGKLQLVARDFPNHDYYNKRVPGFGTLFNVITHRSVALKDCPKDLDYAWIVARGNEILAGATAPAPTPPEDPMQYTIFARVMPGKTDPDEWMLGCVDAGYAAGHDPADPVQAPETEWARQRGYRVSDNWDFVSQLWIPMWGPRVVRLEGGYDGSPYVKMQDYLRAAAAEYDRVTAKRITNALAGER
jgi:hypothetical protein